MLPLQYTHTKNDSGVKNIPTVNSAVLTTLVWFLVSIAAVVYGISHCRSNAYNYSLVCSSTKCTIEYPADRIPDFAGQPVVLDERNSLVIQKSDIDFTDNVSVDEQGKVVDTGPLTARDLSKLGTTTSIRYFHYPDGPSSPATRVKSSVIFPPMDMGKRKARGALRKIKEYTSGKTTGLNLQHGQAITALGILLIIFGLVSIILSLVLGTWKDEKLSRRPWMRSRRRAD